MGAWTSYAALYYPYATFGNEHWLRQALLFWDSVGLIRPAGAETELAERGPVEQAIAREEPEFLEPLTPRDDDLQPVSDGILEAGMRTMKFLIWLAVSYMFVRNGTGS